MSAVTAYLKEEYNPDSWVFLKKWDIEHIKNTITVCGKIQQKIINRVDESKSAEYKKLLEKLDMGGRVMEWRFTKSEDFMKYVWGRLEMDLIIDLYKISWLNGRICALKNELGAREGFQILDYESGGIIIESKEASVANVLTMLGWLRNQNAKAKIKNRRRGKDKRRAADDSDSDDTDDSDS